MALAALGLLCLLLRALQGGLCTGAAFWGASLQSCRGGRMQILLTPRPGVVSSVLRLLDPAGTPHLLKNDSACGTSVAPQPDGSVEVETAFDGCYTKAQDGSYRTTVQIEGVRPDGRMTSYKKELRCPEPHLVLDPPSASLCSAVQLADRLPCGSSRVSHGECSHWGCCFDHRDRVTPCYYGKAVTARCTPEGSFSLAISRDAVLPPLRLDSLHLLSGRGGRCGPVARNKVFVVFDFPVSACGTTFKLPWCIRNGPHRRMVCSSRAGFPPERLCWATAGTGKAGQPAGRNHPLSKHSLGQDAGGHRVYENKVSADGRVLLPPSGSVTRDSNFRLTIRCSYSGDESLPVSVLVASLPPPAAIAQQGPLALEMRIARDETYSSYYAGPDYPVVKLLHDAIHLEVRLLGRRDPAFVLLLHECWATPSTNPLQRPRWPLLESGCPYRGDNYQTQLVPLWRDPGLPFPSHHQRFIIRTFTFADTDSQRMLTGPVYFHCSASVCVPSAREQCSARCEASMQGRRQRDARGGAPAEPGRVRMLASAGPVDFFSRAMEASLPEGSGALPPEGFLRWEDGLSLAAGVAAALAFGSMVLVVLRRRGEQQAGEGLSCA